MGTLSLDKKGLALAFDYDPWVVAEVKEELSGSRWDKSARVWRVPWPLVRKAMAFAEERGWVVADNVHGRLARLTVDPDEAVERAYRMMRRVGLDLYDYQPKGIRFLAAHQNAILGWEMRTGKTVVTLGAHPPGAPLLVTAPASALYQWAGEIADLRPDLEPFVVNRRSWRWPEEGEAIIGSWAALPPAVKTPAGWIRAQPGAPENITAVPDEVHKAKNPSAARTQNMRSILKAVREAGGRSWALTGTPVQNHPMELWHLLGTLGLEKSVFGSWPEFLSLYDAERQYGVLEFGAPKADVPKRLRRVMHRMTFAEAAPHIKRSPPRFLPVDVTLSAKKRKVWEESYETWEEAMQNSAVAPLDFAEARKELAALKAKSLPQVIADIEDSGGGPIIVFSAHRAPIEMLAQRKGWTTIMGGVSKKERENRRLAFQKGEIDGIGITIGAGQEALTLSRARTEVFVDLDWNPTANAQAMARGLSVEDAEAPGVFILTARGTVDERVNDILYRKTKMIEGTLGDRKPPPSRRQARRRRRRR